MARPSEPFHRVYPNILPWGFRGPDGLTGKESGIGPRETGH